MNKNTLLLRANYSILYDIITAKLESHRIVKVNKITAY